MDDGFSNGFDCCYLVSVAKNGVLALGSCTRGIASALDDMDCYGLLSRALTEVPGFSVLSLSSYSLPALLIRDRVCWYADVMYEGH